MRKSNLLLILLCLLFVSCKDKESKFLFSWEGDFSHEFLELVIDHPEVLSQMSEDKSKSKNKNTAETTPIIVNNEPLEEFVFYGIDMKQMGEIIKGFGDCKLDFKITFTVETNGLKINKVYIAEGAELFCDYEGENILPEIVFETAQIMVKDYPVHSLKYGSDKKSFSYYCKYPSPFVLFDSSVTGEEVDLGKMEMPKKQKGVKFRLKDNSAVITVEDKDLGVWMQMKVAKQ